jgi:hypothetical protein
MIKRHQRDNRPNRKRLRQAMVQGQDSWLFTVEYYLYLTT